MLQMINVTITTNNFWNYNIYSATSILSNRKIQFKILLTLTNRKIYRKYLKTKVIYYIKGSFYI